MAVQTIGFGEWWLAQFMTYMGIGPEVMPQSACGGGERTQAAPLD
jgi:hypothetical protein